MTKSRIAKAVAAVAGVAMSLGMAMPAGAVTVADLQAQIAALMAQLNALQGGTTTTTATFTRDLTVGSTGADVTALQQILVSKGYLTMPAGTAFGYFGGLTKAAVARWQAAAGVSPAAGYFGAKSRAALSASAGTTTGGTTTGGTTTGGTTTTGGVSGVITTPGAEGTLTVTAAPISNSTLYANDKMDDILAFNAKAIGSDIALQRVRVNLGSNTNLYNQVLQTLYVVDDAGRTLASLDMNSSNVVKDSDGTFFADLTGFSSVVPMGTQRTYHVKADLRSTIDSTYRTTYSSQNVPVNGVRGVDGAGIDLYGPSTAISSTFTVSTSLAQSAQLTLSTDPNNPLAQEVVANGGSNNDQLDKLPVLVFNIRADKDDVKITDLQNFVMSSTGSTGATASTTYLYAGNGVTGTLLGSAAVGAAGDFDFNNMSYVIPKGTTATFTVAADIRSANSTATTFSASLTGNTTNVVGTNSNGDTVTNVSGSATGNSVIVRNVGPVFTLNSAPSIVKSSTAAQNNTSTSTITATFSVHIQAVGGNIYFGTQTASSTFNLALYKGGVRQTLAISSSTSFVTPSTGVVSTGLTNANFELQQNNSTDVTVTYIGEGRTTAGALVSTDNYAVQFEAVNWSTTDGGPVKTTNFMENQTSWRTSTVALP